MRKRGNERVSQPSAEWKQPVQNPRDAHGCARRTCHILTLCGWRRLTDCYRNLRDDKVLSNQFDNVASTGNVVQCGEIGSLGADTTFTVALGYGADAASAVAAANGSLAAGFTDRETVYRTGWNGYVDGLRPAPASVSANTPLRRVYYVAAMALHAAEDKTFRGASVAGFATPRGPGCR